MLPYWDLTTIYPGIDSSAFANDFSRVIDDIDQLAQLFDAYGIGEQPATALNDQTVTAFDIVIEHYNRLLEASRTLSAYLVCLVSTNSQDTLAQAKLSELQQSSVRLAQLGTRFTAWIGSLDVENLIARSPLAGEHAFMLRKAKIRAAHLMTPGEETLAAELNPSSGNAWSRLHGDLTSQLTVELELSGQQQELPMSMVRNLAFDPNRDSRKRAYEAELAAWERVSVPLAAALNSIKGQVNTLTKRRGWESPLEASLFDNNMDRETLDAMLEAARESFPSFRSYLHAKARVLGLHRLAWYDLNAPISQEERVWQYDEARVFIIEQFATYSTRLSDFAARAFREQWIDAEPRTGKRDGAFCILVRGDQSRVMANYKSAFGGVSTLAHELGHGYHNFNLAGRTMLQRATPAALAETASTFCETIIRQAALQTVGPQEQIAILEASLQGSTQVVVDITSRLLFEQHVFEARRKRELSIEELNDLMLEAQRETYGDGLDASALHPYMWAVKQHYYSSGLSFYNYPYMFGLLFGLGLYARYSQEPEAFRKGYDDLLSSTGLADAATLAGRFGIDIHSPDFWRGSLDVIRSDIERFEMLTQQ
jgi:pepF/M3 family oligoendopeptidase